jgi:hypothetical protein
MRQISTAQILVSTAVVGNQRLQFSLSGQSMGSLRLKLAAPVVVEAQINNTRNSRKPTRIRRGISLKRAQGIVEQARRRRYVIASEVGSMKKREKRPMRIVVPMCGVVDTIGSLMVGITFW